MARFSKQKSEPVTTAEEAVLSEALTPKAEPAPRRRNEVLVEQTIKFGTWFVVKSLEDSRLKAHRGEEVRAYMAGRGLSDTEPAWRYEAALRTYFGV
jgi:hypothetical protein